ncbi:hypothetical protein [Mycobacteroides abscessus]
MNARTNEEMMELARELLIPGPWNREKFIENLARRRGRPIRLIPTDTVSLADSPCGLWLVRDDDDVILYEEGTSEPHIDQIIRHEVGHMVLGHDQSRADEDRADVEQAGHAPLAIFQTLFPNIDPETIRSILGLDSEPYDSEHEGNDSPLEGVELAVELADGIQQVLRRTDFASDQEREAETFANLLMIAGLEQEEQRSVMRSVFFRRRSR